MVSRTRKLEIAIFTATLAILLITWVMNGYDDTWLYVTVMLATAPAWWLSFRRKQ